MIDSSSKESPQTALEERKRILSIMRKKGFKLSEDSSSWVPLEESENNTNRIDLPDEENEISTFGAIAPMLIVFAFISLLAGFDTTHEGPFASCCLFLALGCIGMLANSEGRFGATILKIMVILFFFWILFMFILDSMMSGGWGGMGVGGLSGWGGP